jgi:hypothetical protein
MLLSSKQLFFILLIQEVLSTSSPKPPYATGLLGSQILPFHSFLSRAIAACLPFRVLVPRTTIPTSPSSPVRGNINKLPCGKDLKKFFPIFFKIIFCGTEACGFLFLGGFKTRLALHFGGPDLLRRAQMGPSAEAASSYGFYFRSPSGERFYDDLVSTSAIDALLGKSST